MNDRSLDQYYVRAGVTSPEELFQRGRRCWAIAADRDAPRFSVAHPPTRRT